MCHYMAQFANIKIFEQVSDMLALMLPGFLSSRTCKLMKVQL